MCIRDRDYPYDHEILDTIIDMVTVHLDIKKNCYFAEFSNLGLGKVPIADEYPEKFDRLLCGGIWCIVQLDYEAEGDNNFGIEDIDGNPLRSKQKKQREITPISIRKLTPSVSYNPATNFKINQEFDKM